MSDILAIDPARGGPDRSLRVAGARTGERVGERTGERTGESSGQSFARLFEEAEPSKAKAGKAEAAVDEGSLETGDTEHGEAEDGENIPAEVTVPEARKKEAETTATERKFRDVATEPPAREAQGRGSDAADAGRASDPDRQAATSSPELAARPASEDNSTQSPPVGAGGSVRPGAADGPAVMARVPQERPDTQPTVRQDMQAQPPTTAFGAAAGAMLRAQTVQAQPGSNLVPPEVDRAATRGVDLPETDAPASTPGRSTTAQPTASGIDHLRPAGQEFGTREAAKGAAVPQEPRNATQQAGLVPASGQPSVPAPGGIGVTDGALPRGTPFDPATARPVFDPANSRPGAEPFTPRSPDRARSEAAQTARPVATPTPPPSAPPSVRPGTFVPATAVPGPGAEPDTETDPLSMLGGPSGNSAPAAQPGQGAATAPAPSPHLAQQVARQMALAIIPLPDGPVEIRLSPDELGRVRLTVSVVDGAVAVNVQADRADTADLLRRHIETLAREFRDLGYDQSSFSFGQSGQGSAGTGTEAEADGAPPGTRPAQGAEEASAGMTPHLSPASQSGKGLDLRL